MHRNRVKRIALVSAPWPLFNRPSIQIGALKSYVHQQFPAIEVRAYHLYLQVAEAIGYSLYQALSERTWLAEAVYAALLYPERLEGIAAHFYRQASGNSRLRQTDFKKLVARVGAISDHLLQKTSWSDYDLIGVSACLCQLTSSLYFIKRLKQAHPSGVTVMGGSMITSASGRGLMQAFEEIDYAVIGEGEIPLTHLIEYLQTPPPDANSSRIPGVLARQPVLSERPIQFKQSQNLNDLSRPDYDDYFATLGQLPPHKRFFPTLSAEASRGCWWRKQDASERKAGCAFCNLNLQWKGYRTKSSQKIVSEIDELTRRYKVLSVALMDNALPPRQISAIFKGLTDLNKDLSLFGETRATTSYDDLALMRRAGLEEIQIGIEALSTGLLIKLNKGTHAIDNLEIMKHCEELGIKNSSNLLLQFPGSDAKDVEETLHLLSFANIYRPLRPVNFYLTLGSSVHCHPMDYGLRAVYNHPYYRVLFPEHIVKGIPFMIQAYRGDVKYQRKLWQPVKKQVSEWERSYTELRQASDRSPILGYRDGGTFIIIRHRQRNASAITHRLEGPSRAIYLFCRHHRTLDQIQGQFPSIVSDRLLSFLKMMVAKKLMFKEKEAYLSLAVHDSAKDCGNDN